MTDAQTAEMLYSKCTEGEMKDETQSREELKVGWKLGERCKTGRTEQAQEMKEINRCDNRQHRRQGMRLEVDSTFRFYTYTFHILGLVSRMHSGTTHSLTSEKIFCFSKVYYRGKGMSRL